MEEVLSTKRSEWIANEKISAHGLEIDEKLRVVEMVQGDGQLCHRSRLATARAPGDLAEK